MTPDQFFLTIMIASAAAASIFTYLVMDFVHHVKNRK